MISRVFKRYYTRLNKEQKKAVDTIDGPVMVIAGPGTGKTQILTLRIANILLKTDTSADSILALTFTEAGVYAMRKRLVEIIGSAAYKVSIHTFHSFCNDIILKYPEEFPRIIGSIHGSEVDQINIVEDILGKGEFEFIRPYGDNFYYVRHILAAVRDLKREGKSPEDFKKEVAKKIKDFKNNSDVYYAYGKFAGTMKGSYKSALNKLERTQELARVFESYEKELRKKKLYDYEDMIIEVIRAFKAKPEFLLMQQENYQYILADEHQDANNAQNSLLELLANFHESPNLFIVGDEKQAIFRFQGASIDNFLYFKKVYPKAELVYLVENYRSTQSILDGAHSVISNNVLADPKLRPKLIARAGHSEKKIWIKKYGSPTDELNGVADGILRDIKAGIHPDEIAVLYRDNRDALPLTRELAKRGIAFSVLSDENILDHVVVRKFLTLLKAVGKLGNNEYLAEVLSIDFLSLDGLETYKILAYAAKQRAHIFEVIKSNKLLEEANVTAKPFLELYKKIESWHKAAHAKPLFETFDIVLRECGLLEHMLRSTDGHRDLESLATFFEYMKRISETNRNMRLGDFLKHLDKLEFYNIVINGTATDFPGRVKLMTAHASKGREFDSVYIIGATDGHFGNRHSRSFFDTTLAASEPQTIDDERRLFYVAVTRARKHLTVSYSERDTSGKQCLPSQFIEEFNKKFVELEDVKSMSRDVKEYLPSNRSIVESLKDKVYLNSLFLEQGLSVSALNNYLSCPWKYFYINLLRVPKSYEKYQIYGTAVHAALQDFFEKYKSGENPTKKYLLTQFDYHLKRSLADERILDELIKKGERALGGYFDTYKSSWLRQILNEYKTSVLLSRSGGPALHLTGKLDKIEFENNGTVTVIDYKTSVPKTRNVIEGKTKSSEGGEKRQLVFYKLLLDGDPKKKYNMAKGVIDFIEPDEKGMYKREEFEISRADVEDLKKIILKSADEILALEFWNKRCKDPKCSYCKLRELTNS
ncbi:ATP-dependent helicase [Candidatus Parcubacteria bacterium]|nr:ATP-dependent helicase [Candidatus Parcubacteria bacterium]